MKTIINLPTCVLVSFLVRLLVMGASIGESIALIGLSALYAFHLYLESKKIPIANKDLLDRVVALEETLQATKEKVLAMNLNSALRRN